jgi:hypothetical protein
MGIWMNITFSWYIEAFPLLMKPSNTLDGAVCLQDRLRNCLSTWKRSGQGAASDTLYLLPAYQSVLAMPY